MHRRDFLKTSAAAATAAVAATPEVAAERVASGVTITGSASPARTAPVIITQPSRELVLATPWPIALASVGESPARLAHAIEAGSNGRLRVVIEHRGEAGIELIATGQADLYFASDSRNAGFDTAFALFAAVPGLDGLDAASHRAWLVHGGGQRLWDELAGSYEVKPLLAGHAGSAPGLWARALLPEDARNAEGQTIAARGFARDVYEHAGATLSEIPATGLADALAEGRVDAVEWAGPFASLTTGMDGGAKFLYRDGVMAHGNALTLGVRRGLWDRLDTTDRALIEHCAKDEWETTLVEAAINDPKSLVVLTSARGVEVRDLPRPLRAALDAAARDVVGAVAFANPMAGRIGRSLEGFRQRASQLFGT